MAERARTGTFGRRSKQSEAICGILYFGLFRNKIIRFGCNITCFFEEIGFQIPFYYWVQVGCNYKIFSTTFYNYYIYNIDLLKSENITHQSLNVPKLKFQNSQQF